jgi:resuscitation-promoting factor RpfB
LPLPLDVQSLPSIQVLLDGHSVVPVRHPDADRGVDVDLVALEAIVSPSPARAEPHDASAWLPLPDDLHELPPVRELLAPAPEVQAAVVAEAEAVVQSALAAAEAVVAPSPARAEPHDASAWLPLPSIDELPPVPDTRSGAAGAPAGPRRRRTGTAPAARALFVILLVVATVVSGVWISQKLTAPAGSEVTLIVDGQRVQLRSEAATIGALLSARHVRLGVGDTVTPSRATGLSDGMHVDIVRAFPVTVDLDGKVRTVRTTATSADALGKQLKIGKLVALRGTTERLESGASVQFRTRRAGSLEVDGQHVLFDSPSLTVAELLDSYHVALVGDDYVTPSADTRLTDGTVVTVSRVGAQTTQTTEEFAFDEVQQADPDLPIGQTREVQKGKNGIYTVTHRQKVENGQVLDDQIVSKVPTTRAQPHIVAYGTKADWHWDELARCESGGRWDTIDANPDGYDGGLGIYVGTWRAFGGTEFAPRAGYATREQQIIVGMRIHDALGWDPWGCANNVLHWS